MSDIQYPEEVHIQHWCKLLRMRAEYLRQQAALLEQMARETEEVEALCCTEIDDALNGRR